MFDAADTNGDGAIDLAELEAACGGSSFLRLALKKAAEWPELSDAQYDEIKAWIENELTTGDETITFKEAKTALANFAKKYGYELSEADWKKAKKAFKAVDTNGDKE